MEKRVSVRGGSIQKENVPRTVMSPIQKREAARVPLVLQQCSELLALQESIILSGIQRQREHAQRQETSRAECEDVYSQLNVRPEESEYSFLDQWTVYVTSIVFLTAISGRKIETC